MKRYDANDIWEVFDGEYIKYDDHLFELLIAFEPKVCKWTNKDGFHETECGKEWHALFIFKIHFTYCPYCGGKIKVAK